jgi:hypothetical protein
LILESRRLDEAVKVARIKQYWSVHKEASMMKTNRWIDGSRRLFDMLIHIYPVNTGLTMRVNAPGFCGAMPGCIQRSGINRYHPALVARFYLIWATQPYGALKFSPRFLGIDGTCSQCALALEGHSAYSTAGLVYLVSRSPS